MKYSVIVPVYNGDEYIEECILSVLKQNRKDVELIIVNDGSTDRTVDVCKKYYDKIVLIDKPNSGSMDSWIKGVEQATGDYICFIDADDLVAEDYFSILDEYVGTHDIILFDFYRMYKNKIVPEKVNRLPYGTVDADTLKDLQTNYYNFYPLYSFYRWDKVIKSELIKKNIRNIRCRAVYFEDLIIGLLNLHSAHSIYYLDKKLYYYRMRAKSVSRGFNKRIFDDNKIVEDESKRIASEFGYCPGALKKMHVYFLFHYVRWSMKSKEKPARVKVLLSDVIAIDGLSKKATFMFYKFRLDTLFNTINELLKKKKTELELF